MSMETQFDLGEQGSGPRCTGRADVRIGQVASMGQRVVQPIVNQQVEQVMNALDARVAAKGGDRRGAEDRASAAEEGIHPGSPEALLQDGRRGRRTRVAPAGLDAMGQPFRIGVMQLTMEPLEEMLETAEVMDRVGMDTIWLAEAYPWWRKHGMEARSSTVVSALIAERTERIAVGWGIISPFTHVTRCRRRWMRARRPGGRRSRTLPARLRNVRDLPEQRPDADEEDLGPMRDAVAITRGDRQGAFEYEGETWSASVPHWPTRPRRRARPPVYVAATAPKMQALAARSRTA